MLDLQEQLCNVQKKMRLELEEAVYRRAKEKESVNTWHESYHAFKF